MENPIKIHDLGVPLFLETPIWDQCRLKLFQSQWSTCSGFFNSHWFPELGDGHQPNSRGPICILLYIIYIYHISIIIYMYIDYKDSLLYMEKSCKAVEVGSLSHLPGFQKPTIQTGRKKLAYPFGKHEPTSCVTPNGWDELS